MSVTIDTVLQTYLAAVTVPGDFSGLPDGDFEVAIGSYTSPGAFQAPDAVSINSTVSVTLTGRFGAGKSFDPESGTYYLWGRATRTPDETLTRGSTRITVITTGGVPVNPAVRYVPQQATAPDPTVYEGWLDSSTSPPTLKGWNGSAWVAIGGGGSGGVTSFQTRTGAVSLTKADVTGTGLAASDVGADASGAASTAQAAAIAAAATDATTKANAAQSAATSAAATDATSKVAAEAVIARAAEALAALKSANLSDLGNTATARTNLGLGTAATQASTAFDAAGAAATAQAAAIAASQPLDSDLTAIAALTTTSYGRAFLALADAAAGRTALGLGTAATSASTAFDASGAAAAAQAASQPLDSDLTAIAALTTTTFGRSFLALADAAAARTLLGLGTLATQSGTFSGTSSGTNTGDQTITLTGDVTGSGTGSFAATMKNTGTAGTYGDATHTVTLTTDAQGRVTAVTTNLISGSSFTRQLKTANYSAALGEYVAADTTGGAFTVTLPAASGGRGAIVLKWVAGTAAPSVALTGSDHFDLTTGSTGGAFSLLNQAATYDSDGTSVWSVRNSFSLSTLDTRYRNAPVAYTIDPFLPNTTLGATVNRAVFMRIMIGGSWSISNIGFYVRAVGGNVSVAAFSNTGSGAPGTLLANSGSVACPAIGAASVALGSTVTVNGGDWLAISTDSSSASINAVQASGTPNPPIWRNGFVSLGSITAWASNPTLSGLNYGYVLWGT